MYRESIHRPGRRQLPVGTIYTTLSRLEEKELLESWETEPRPERGGRSRRQYELTAAGRSALREARRAAAGVALGTAFLLVWVNLAVGVIGASGNAANLMYAGVLAVGIGGAVAAGLEPRGMARALVATAVAQALVAVIAVLAGVGLPASPPLEVLAINGFFAALWLGSAWLFRRAARELPRATAGAARRRGRARFS